MYTGFMIAIFIFLVALSFQLGGADARLIKNFGNCAELNNYYINRAIPLVGPYGLTSSNAYTKTRSPGKPKDPGTPGGPAGLRLRRLYSEPKRVAFDNITEGVEDMNGEGSEGNGLVAGRDFSTTNVQIKGVDEPDIIKTDGRRVYALSGRVFSVVQVLKDGASGYRSGKLILPTYPTEMLFEGDYILVIGQDSSYRRPVYRRYVTDPSYGEESTVIYQINVAGGIPKLFQTLHLEGRYVKSREVDGVARLVIRFSPLNSIWLYYTGWKGNKAQTTKWNREIIQYSSPGNWLPTYRLHRNGGVQTGVYVSCSETYHSPRIFAGFKLLTVVTLPIGGVLSPSGTASIISDADTVYATRKSMYVTTSEFRFNDVPTGSTRWGANYQTSIHKFALNSKGAQYVASGSVSGSVINQFAMHEYKDNFFIATTDGARWWTSRDTSKSKVSSFWVNKQKGILEKIGEVGNLGIGERIFSVRYLADTAYVVTFRQVDPLYIIDLSIPTKLKVTGELKIPGFSSYLHLVGPGRILGVGQEATLTGRTTGAKVSLFDVSDKTNPREISAWSLKGSYTNAQWDHRAFLYWWRERVAVMPVSVYTGTGYFRGAIVLDITDSKITERGRVTHISRRLSYTPSIKRNAIIGRVHLWSMSSELLQVNNIKNLKQVESQVTISQ